MIRKVTIIWRVCNRLAKFYIGYLIRHKVSKRLPDLVSHFMRIAIDVELSIHFQVLEVQSYFTVFQSVGASNVYSVKGVDISLYYR